MRGLFITFEGPEGAGKSTQVRRLAARMEAQGLRTLCTREPGGTPMGEAIRGILQHDRAGEPPCAESEILLFLASRAHLVRSVIRPALIDGICVLCDRFSDSTTAYQGYGRGFAMDDVVRMNRFAIGDTTPDVTLLMDIDVSAGFARLARRRGAGDRQDAPDRMERETLAFHERVRAGFLDLARREPERFRVFDAGRPEDAIAEDVWLEVRNALDRARR